MRPSAVGASLHFSDEQLALGSAAAVRGRVVALRSRWDPDAAAIYTFVTLDVARSWGLTPTLRRVVVKQLGGVVGDTALLVGGQARFAVGEDVLVFLEVRPRDRTLSVTGLEHGKWTVEGTGAGTAPAAVRDLPGLDPRAPSARRSRPLDALERLASLAGTRVVATNIQSLEPDADPAPGPAAALDFALLSSATPARWHEADAPVPVYVDAQAGGHPQIAGGGIAEGIAATALWSDGGALTLRPGRFRSARCFSHAEIPDGRISIAFGDPCGEIADASPTLAIGGAFYTASDVRVVNGVPFWKITAGMIVTDDAPAKFAGMPGPCYADVLAHELGHAIGFGHATTAPSVMAPSLSADCQTRGTMLPLQADDRAGLAALYPRPGLPAPGVPNGIGAAVSGTTVTVFWGAPLWGAAPTGYRLEAGSAPGVSDRGVADVSGTSFVTANVPSGDYYVRVRGRAGTVLGASTPDVLVAVGGPPPGPPSNVAVSAGSGGLVHAAWVPPATGTVTGYVVQVGFAPGQTAYQFAVATPSIGGPVPPGTYVLRVVAMNGTTGGPPSSDVTFTVP